MIVWVKDLVTGNKWILDHDKTKFYPYDPDEDNEKQFTIFDYLEE
jgi:hypothetical protein